MTRPDDQLLYDLLPAFIRNRDVGEGEPLRALMLVLEREYRTLHRNIGDLHRDAFIETCDEWVVPYIGELVGVRPDAATLFLRSRQWVADVLSYRRGKGVPEALRRAVEAATGWRARVVGPGSALVASAEVADAGAPSLTEPRTPRIAPAACSDTVLGPRELGVEIHRLESFALERAWARKVGDGRYTFHPFGIDCPLAPPARTERGAELEPPGAPFPAPFEIRLDGRPVPPEALETADLAQWQPPRPPMDQAGKDRPLRVAVDPERGRLTVEAGATAAEPVEVAWSYHAPGAIGGGPYARGEDLVVPGELPWRAVVGRRLPPPAPGSGAPPRFRSLLQALAAWKAAGESGVIRILDSANYAVARSGPFEAELPAGRRLVIEAADGCRPCLVGALRLGTAEGAGGLVRLDGLMIDGTIRAEGNLTLELRHTTLKPPQPGEKSLPRLELRGVSGGRAGGGSSGMAPVRLRVVRSICGPVHLASGNGEVHIEESILDAGAGDALAAAPGTRLVGELLRSTVFGSATVQELPRADGVLFTGPVRVAVRHGGSVSHSFVPEGSLTPPRVRCQPQEALDGAPSENGEPSAPLTPAFVSRRYGDPGYARLDRRCPPEIRHGSEEGGEIGAFHFLGEHRRDAALAAVLEEFVPWGLEPRVFYAD